MTWQEEVELQADLAAKKALNENRIETAQRLLELNLVTPEQIASVTSLPLEKVLELKKEAKPAR